MTEPSEMSTDRQLTNPAELGGLVFGEDDGLLPMVAQDADTGRVLMLAYANQAAVEATLVTGEAHFWSRSRKALWRKGETSGNVLSLVSLHTDCDGDALLALVRPAGPACHTGETTCFGAGAEPRAVPPAAPTPDVLRHLDETLRDRAEHKPEGSYTTKLLEDPNLRLKKLGEETAELVAALATGDKHRAVEETADLLYHALVALRAEDIGLAAVIAALEDRAG